MNRKEWLAVGHRMRVTRMVLGITEQEAASGFGVSLRTYRGYEAGRRQRSAQPACKFARQFDVSLDWLLAGEAAMISRHLAVGTARVAILPAGGAWWRS